MLCSNELKAKFKFIWKQKWWKHICVLIGLCYLALKIHKIKLCVNYDMRVVIKSLTKMQEKGISDAVKNKL
jgi:hypothetical protein